jgi:hypothetical protein
MLPQASHGRSLGVAALVSATSVHRLNIGEDLDFYETREPLGQRDASLANLEVMSRLG